MSWVLARSTYWPSTLASIYQNPYWMIHRTGINESRDRLRALYLLNTTSQIG
jgi:hypothetical protein